MHINRSVLGLLALSGVMAATNPANAALTLTSDGMTAGFSLSTFYSDPGVTYGALSVTTTTDGHVIATGYARNELLLFNDVDGQTHGTALLAADVGAYGVPYSLATAGGKTFYAPGYYSSGYSYYEVDTATLALTVLSLTPPANPYLGLWANPVTGHLVSSSIQGLIDIDPVTGTQHAITAVTGFDGVTISPDGKTVYGEIGGNIIGYDIATGVQVANFSGNGHSPDGTGIISGGAFNGDVVVNNNDGTVGLIDAVSGMQTIIASGGTRGDFVGADLTNGTLFLAFSDAVYRLALSGATIGGGTGGGTSDVPEPLTLSLFGAGIAGAAVLRRRKKQVS